MALVVGPVGHARASAQLVGLVARHKPDIFLKKDDLEVNGKSIMGLMSLGLAKGAEITIAAQGADAQAAVEALSELVNKRFVLE